MPPYPSQGTDRGTLRVISIVVANMSNVGQTRQDMVRVDRKTIYGNPYPEAIYGLELCLRRFDHWIDDRPLLVERLTHAALALERPVVYFGCWCRPKPCHGDTLKRLVMERLS